LFFLRGLCLRTSVFARGGRVVLWWWCWFGAVLPGWKQSTKNITSFGDLPAATKEYIAFIERSVGVHVQWVGVGAGRDELIYQP
jgi:hypothetical protein